MFLHVSSFYIEISKCDFSVYAGCIAGVNEGTIICCINKCNLNITINSEYAYTHVGGMVGDQNEGVMKYCYNSGKTTITAKQAAQICVGALIGHMGTDDSLGSISNCYSIGPVVVNIEGRVYNQGFGVIGHKLVKSNCEISNCYYLIGSSPSGVGYNYEDATGVIEGR